MLLLSRFSRVRLLATLWTGAYQAPLSMVFSRQEYLSGVPLPSPDRDEGAIKQCISYLMFFKAFMDILLFKVNLMFNFERILLVGHFVLPQRAILP